MFLPPILTIVPTAIASILLSHEPQHDSLLYQKKAADLPPPIYASVRNVRSHSSSTSFTSDMTKSHHNRAMNMGPTCGPGVGKCSRDLCCSPSGMLLKNTHLLLPSLSLQAGYCGITLDHCRSPECQINYGICDGSKTPQGGLTLPIPRPHTGAVPYGPIKVSSCTVPNTIALTFDDGPNIYTHELLDILDSYNAKATFFISGINSGKGQIDDFRFPWGFLIQRMHRDGHQIASHTWSHQDLSKIPMVQRLDELVKNEAALRNILGGFPAYIRPPYSSCTQESGCLDDLGKLGYHLIYYDVDTDDYNNDHPERIQRSKDIFDQALASHESEDRPLLLIAHDVHEQTVHNLTQHILREIDDAGYRAVTVGDCLNDPKDLWYRWDGRRGL
jgi:peptidoglycan/xylan/chitin deacetylase (PgdA/CDA1 family)